MIRRHNGLIVYRERTADMGIIGIRRGVITRHYYSERDANRMTQVLWEVTWDCHVSLTGVCTIGPYVEKGFFDYGLLTLTEITWLLTGALIGDKGPVYNEGQPQSLIDHLPLYRRVLDNPQAPWIPA